MRRELKEHLKSIFEAPPPLRKKEFMQKWINPQMNFCGFLFSQMAYIRKWIWGISAAVFTVAMFGTITASKNLVWFISALTPLLAVTVITECGRSENYEMAELEMATRFSLRSVVFARLGILGMENLIVLCSLLVFGIKSVEMKNGELELIWTGVCIIIPYLLTDFIGLQIVRRLKGQEAVYLCAGVAFCISASTFLFRDIFIQIYKEWNPLWWVSIVLLLCVGVAGQYGNIISRTEELT